MDPSHVQKWLLLFEKEIVELLAYNQNQWHILSDLLPHNQLKQYDLEASKVEIQDDGENMNQLEDIARRLWTEIIATDNSPNLFIKVCEFVQKVNPDLSTLIQHQGVSQSRLIEFIRVLIHLDPYIDTVKALNYLSNYSAKMASTLEPIQQRLSKNEINELEARLLLVRNIPFFGQHSVEHLMFTVWSNGSVQAKQMIEKLKPRFEQVYDYILSVEVKPNRIIVSANTSIASVLADLSNHKNDPLDSINVPKICKLAGLMDYAKEMPLNLREYQKELAENAVNGDNTLICAPTNSGKTLVAVHVMRERFYHFLEKRQQFKAVFLVPTRVLVEQQYNVLQNYFPQLKIEHLAGDSNGSPVLAKINAADIVVITPQLFLNALKSQPLADYEQVNITNFSLIVFDESHRCNEKHPYNEILKIYHETKLLSTSKMPQIIGLTASIGTGDAKDLQETVEYVAKICSNLDVRRINHVRKHRAELKKNVPVTNDELMRCYEKNTRFFQILLELKLWLENNLLTLIADEKTRKRIEEALEIGRLNNDIYSGIKQLENNLIKDEQLDEGKRQLAVQILQHLITVSNTARAVRLFDKDTALDTFKNHEAKHSSSKQNMYTQRMSNDLVRLQTANDFKVSSMLQKLIDEIENLFKSNSGNVRCLIFTEKREHCAVLAELIKKHTGREARYLTGVASAELKGLNENQQRDTLRDFKSGRVSILCSTSVGDEGLDIAECKLVIKYNYVTNAIAHVQRRGRGRAQDTRSILLAESNYIHEREEENIKKERMMNDSLNFIDLDLFGFFSKVEDKIRKNKEDRDKERLNQLVKQSVRNLQPRDVYVMICKSCDGFISLSTDIYSSHGHYYVVADPTIWDRVNVNQMVPIDRPDSSTPVIGKIFCQNVSQVQGGQCSAKIGSVIIEKSGGGVRLPIFSIKSVAFINAGIGWKGKCKPPGKNERFTRSQWKKVVEQLFDAPELSQHEMAVMLKSSPKCCFNDEVEKLIQSCVFST